jgi:hypothetical protein
MITWKLCTAWASLIILYGLGVYGIIFMLTFPLTQLLYSNIYDMNTCCLLNSTNRKCDLYCCSHHIINCYFLAAFYWLGTMAVSVIFFVCCCKCNNKKNTKIISIDPLNNDTTDNGSIDVNALLRDSFSDYSEDSLKFTK